MARFLLAGAICLLSLQDARAAKPVPLAPAPSGPVGRERIEALLQSPAQLDAFESTSVGGLLSALRAQKGLSIRFDVPELSNMYEFESGDGSSRTIARRHSTQRSLIAGLMGGRAASASAGSLSLSSPLAIPIRQSTFYAPLQPAIAAVPEPAATSSPVHVPTLAVVSTATTSSGSATLQCEKAQPPAALAKTTATQEDFFKRIASIKVPSGYVNGQTITVATALRIALDAVPGGDDDDSSGLPMAMTDATRLDFLVEDDGILITTRLKALTAKETRVYSLKNLRNIDAHELSTVICQSVRPWSWRSRIDELGEQLKSCVLSIPQSTLRPLVQSALDIASSESGIEISASSVEKKPNAQEDAQQTAMMTSAAVASGLVTLAQASLSTLEVLHYADPPTGSIRVLPGKLIITQSQTAHREIAALLKQLSDE